MYAFYTYKPAVAGLVSKQLSLVEILDRRYCHDEQARLKNVPRSERSMAYVHAHRQMVHQYPGIDPWMLAPVVDGQVMADLCPLVLVEQHFAQTMTRKQAAANAQRYFERVEHCILKQPNMNPFGSPKQAANPAFYDHQPHYPSQPDPFPSLRQIVYWLAEKRGEASPSEVANHFVKEHTRLVSQSGPFDPYLLPPNSDYLMGWAPTARDLVVTYLRTITSDEQAERLADLYGIALKNGVEATLYSVVIKPVGADLKVFVASNHEAAIQMMNDLISRDGEEFEYHKVVAVSRF